MIPIKNKTAFCYFIIILLPILWWYPLLSGKLPDFMDTVTYLFPMRMAVAEQFRSGSLPLWLPNILSGTPLAANPQLAVWYPPQILFYFLPGVYTFGIIIVFHYILAGVGMFRLGKFLTKSHLAALFGAMTFQFSAMLISRVALLPHVYAAIWIPFIFLTFEKLLSQPSKNIINALTISFLLTLQFLAGSPQFTFYTLIAIFILLVSRIRAIKEFGSFQFIKILIFSAIMTLLLCSIQLFPTIDFMNQVARTAIKAQALKDQSLNDGFIWRSLLGFTGPIIEDTDSINAVGFGAILLAIVSLINPIARRKSIPYLLIATAGFILSLGPLSPYFYRWFPLYDRFHAPRRILMLWSFAVPVAGIIGFSLIEKYFQAKKFGQVIVSLLFFIFLSGTAWMLPRLERQFTPPFHLFPDNEYTNLIGNNRFMTIDPTFNYAYDSRRADYGKSIMTNVSTLANLNDVQGYDPLVSMRYAYLRDVACRTSGIFFPSHGVYFSNPASPIFSMLNVNYLIGRFDMFDPARVIPGTQFHPEELARQLILIKDDEKWPLYKFKSFRPEAWSITSIHPVANFRNAIDLFSRTKDITIGFAENDYPIPSPIDSTPTTVTVTKLAGNKIRMDLDSISPIQRVIARSAAWYPGWKATSDDGSPLAVFPLNGAITGIIAAPGTKSITLTYLPVSFIQGLILTSIGLLFSGVLIFRMLVKNRQ